MTSSSKNILVRIGDFLFKWRNYLFPITLIALFISFRPPGEYAGNVWLEEYKDVLGFVLVASGLIFRAVTIGWAYIKRGGLNKQVYADKLVVEGLFGICRNPLYVGNLLVYGGIFILHGHPVVVVTGITLYTFIYIAIVAAEEHYLRAKFGSDYEEYCKKVPRWLPDFSKYKASVAGMDFSIKRSLFKDYTTIFNAIFAITAIEAIEHFTFKPQQYEFSFLAFSTLMAMSTILVLVVAYQKKIAKVKVR